MAADTLPILSDSGTTDVTLAKLQDSLDDICNKLGQMLGKVPNNASGFAISEIEVTLALNTDGFALAGEGSKTGFVLHLTR